MNETRNRKVRRGWAWAGLLFLTVPVWAKLSLGVRFPDLVMENVAPGTVINLRQLKGLPYVVINQSDEMTLDVLVEPEIPVLGPAQAKEGYEPVPTADWLKVVPNRFKLGPGDAASSEVVLSVPDDPGLVGKHFQVNIKAKSQDVGMLALAVNSYVRFSIGAPGPASLKKEKDRQTLQKLDLELNPGALRMEKVPLGRLVPFADIKGAPLKIINKGNDPVKLKLVSIKPEANLREPGWTEQLDPAWLTVKPDVLKLKGNQIREVQVFLTIPDKPENRGKKFMFLLQAEMADLGLPLQFYTRVYVSTE